MSYHRRCAQRLNDQIKPFGKIVFHEYDITQGLQPPSSMRLEPYNYFITSQYSPAKN